MSYCTESECLGNNHTHKHRCTDSHKQTHAHTKLNPNPHKCLSTAHKALAISQTMLTLCALSHKDGGITEALRTSSYPYASSFAKLGLLRCHGVNKTQTFQKINWSNVRKKYPFLVILAFSFSFSFFKFNIQIIE